MYRIKFLTGEEKEFDSLCGVDLYRADLCGANLHYADLSRADLYRADLYRADLRGANLRYADLRYADLRYANLRYADLRYADLSKARLKGTVLDPDKSPNQKGVNCFEKDGDFIIGYRTRTAGHIDKYRDDRYYSADIFSVCEMSECHPGLYLCPTLATAKTFDSGAHPEFIKIKTKASEVHKVGDKYRCRWFYVIGAIDKNE